VLDGYAQRLLDLADEARAAVADNVPRGRLRFGSMESTAAARLAPVLAAFHERYPEVQLELRTGGTGSLVGRVLDGELDAALVCGPVHDARLTSLPLFEEELVVVASLGHPSIKSATDVRTRSLLAFEPGCAYRQRLESWLAGAGVTAERIVELSSYHTMVGCAASGMGIALVPKSLLDSLPARGAVSVHPLPAEIARASTVLVRRAGVAAPAVDALACLLRDVAER
jgi:DNA-binding transcriptional LysR family regulator